MTSPLGIIAMTYRGVDLQPADLHFFFELQIGLNELSEVRGEDTLIPDAIGMQPRNRRATRRYIELEGFVAGAGADEAAQRANFRDTMDTLQDLFDNTLQPGVLSLLTEDGSTRTINARTLNILPGTEGIPSYRSLNIAMESVDPDWSVQSELAGSAPGVGGATGTLG
jgi:hypothetical protein